MHPRRLDAAADGGFRSASRTSAPAVERAVAGVDDVVEAVTEIDNVFISAAAFDNRVVQVAGQKVNIVTLFDFPPAIKAIYTTNAIESVRP